MSGLGRASALLGAGTLVSRLTGLLRTIVLVGVVGAVGSQTADAFAVANQLPNSVFNLISVGVITAVIVPQIVKASGHADGGNAFISKLFTLGTVVLVIATAAAMLAAPWLVSLQLKSYNVEQLALATAFAYWCLPQILFYGLYALLGETLNARRIFGPFTWAPIANNLISIVGFLVVGAMFGSNLVDVDAWTPEMIAWLGGVATAGIAVQALILLVFWRKTGLALKVDFRWRGVGLGNVGRVAGWTLLMAISSMAAGFYQNWVVGEASGYGAGLFVMNNAWLIFMLPYSIIVHSIGTPYFTQLSEHASAGRDDDVRADISRSIRTLGFFLMGALAAVVAAAVPLSRIFTNSAADAVDAAVVLICYLAGLLSLAVLFIVQRTFYAYGDTRTPFFFTLFQCVLIAAGASAAWALSAAGVLPLTLLAAAVALSQSIAGTVQTIVATVLLRRRLGSLETGRWMLALGRFTLAAIPAAAAGWGVFVLLGGVGGWTVVDKIFGALGGGIIGAAALVVYILFLWILRAPELKVAGSLVRRFLPGR
ncbi:murein biosynthesis integral membrane protein MurJ [Microbacterium sp. NPDC055903]